LAITLLKTFAIEKAPSTRPSVFFVITCRGRSTVKSPALPTPKRESKKSFRHVVIYYKDPKMDGPQVVPKKTKEYAVQQADHGDPA
jgi:hypothetical protein